MQEALVEELAQGAVNADAEDGQVGRADLRLIVDQLFFVSFSPGCLWMPLPRGQICVLFPKCKTCRIEKGSERITER